MKTCWTRWHEDRLPCKSAAAVLMHMKEPVGGLIHDSGRQGTKVSPLVMAQDEPFPRSMPIRLSNKRALNRRHLITDIKELQDKGLTEAPPLIVHVWHQSLLHVAKGAHALGGEAMAT